MNVQEGHIVTLKTQEDKVLEGEYEVLGIPLEDGKPSKHALRVKTPQGTTIRIHRSRVNSIIPRTKPEREEQMEEPQVEETKAEETKTEEAEEKKTEQLQPPEQPQPKKAKKKTTKTKTKAQKAEEKAEPFDIKAFVTENNGILLTKKCKFDHDKFKLYSHVVIIESRKIFYCINTYKHPDGTVRLGKNAKMTSYPMKGKKLKRTKVNKKTGDKEVVELVGKKTVEQIIQDNKKKGYREVKIEVAAQ